MRVRIRRTLRCARRYVSRWGRPGVSVSCREREEEGLEEAVVWEVLAGHFYLQFDL